MDADTTNRMIDCARSHGMKVASIFHDAIALQRPDLVERQPDTHVAYMLALGRADVVLPVSHHSGAALAGLFAKLGLPPPPIRPCVLPAEVRGEPRVLALETSSSGPVKILCVSTLEPRKNHKLLIEVFNELQKSAPDMELHLAGARYAGAPEIAKFVAQATAQNPLIHWHENVSHDELRALYRGCDFTVYPSFLEGFGLPIMESLWYARPCICGNAGVLAENAQGGGCVAVDVQNRHELREAVAQLAADSSLRSRLAQEAARRPLKTWNEYAFEIRETLAEFGKKPSPATVQDGSQHLSS
jgi:glycosyltransferase involved in cell wall biosynthesis